MYNPSTEDARNEQAVNAVYAGILRWLDRPENAEMKQCFTHNQAWAVYQQGIDEAVYDAMEAWDWLTTSGFIQGDNPLTQVDALWEDALYQVTCTLCLPDSA
jgi:hypothetical protein